MALRGKQPVDPRALSAEDAALISRDCMRATLLLMGARLRATGRRTLGLK